MNLVEALKASKEAKDIRNMKTCKVVIFPDDPEQYVHLIMTYKDFISEHWEPQGGVEGKEVFGVEPSWVDLKMANELYDAAKTIYDICSDFLNPDDIEFVLKACGPELRKLRIVED